MRSFLLVLSTVLALCAASSLVPFPVRAATVVARPSTQPVHLVGYTRARSTMTLSSEIAGRVISVTADVGDALGPDGLFCRLDDVFVQLDIETNRIALLQAERKLEYDEAELKRYQKLVKKKFTSRNQLDELELRRDQDVLEIQALKTKDRILQERLVRHTIKGPPGQLVVKRKVEPGEWVTPGSPLAVLGDFHTLVVPLALDAVEFAALKALGEEFEVDLPEQQVRLKARMGRLNPAFDPKSRKVNVEIELTPPASLVSRVPPGGMRVKLTLSIPDPMGAVLVPAAAVTDRYEEQWLTREDGSLARVLVLGPPEDQDPEQPLLRVASPDVKPGDVFLLPE